MPLNYKGDLKFNFTFDEKVKIMITYCNKTLNKDCIDLKNQTNKDFFIKKYGSKQYMDVNYLNT